MGFSSSYKRNEVIINGLLMSATPLNVVLMKYKNVTVPVSYCIITVMLSPLSTALFMEGSCGNDRISHLWEADTPSQIWVWEAHFLQHIFYKHLKELLHIRGLWSIKQINNSYILIGCSWELYSPPLKTPTSVLQLSTYWTLCFEILFKKKGFACTER